MSNMLDFPMFDSPRPKPKTVYVVVKKPKTRKKRKRTPLFSTQQRKAFEKGGRRFARASGRGAKTVGDKLIVGAVKHGFMKGKKM